MIRLEKVNADNYQAVLELELADSQRGFVAPNVRSLAQAWVFYDRARPYAICAGDKVVGFIMFDDKAHERKVEVWRLMIGKEFQGKGYGREALSRAIDFLRAEQKFDFIQINYVEGNFAAKRLYEKLCFAATGEMEGNEIVMKLYL